MALVFYDRVRETTTVTGTSDATLLGAVTGFQAFSVVGNGNTCYYTIADQSGGSWEVGIGTYSSVGPTLARTTILSSSNSNNKVAFGAGTKDVFLTYPSSKAVYLDASNNAQPNLGNAAATQLNITGQGDLRLEDTTGGEYVALQAPGTLASSYTLTLPVDDGTNGQALVTDGNGVLSWSTAASGDVYGPASATDNAITRFDGTTGKLIQNSSALVDDAGNVLAGAGLVGAPAFSTTGDTNTGIFFPAADTIAFAEGGAEAMRIDSSGSVLIGTTDNNFVNGIGLKIANSVSARIKLCDSDSGTGASDGFELTAAGTDSYIYNLENGFMAFGTNSAERMRIDSSGNVLIGNTTDPLGGNRLLVQSAATANNNRTFSVYNTAATSTTPFANRLVEISSSGSGADATLHFSDQVANNAYIGMGSGNIYFASSALTELMRITSSGNVGIGTSSPSAQSGFTTSRVVLQINNSGYGQLRLGDGAGFMLDQDTSGTTTTTIRNLYGATSGSALMQIQSGYLTFGTGTSYSERMRIDSSGNVGIGTSSPAYKLHVANYMGLGTQSSTGAGAGISMIPSSTLTNWLVGANYTISGAFEITPSTAGGGSTFSTPSFLINSSGNVGIGTPSPAKKLDVYLGTTGTVEQYLRNTTINLLSKIDGTTSAQIGTETSHPLVFLTGNTERMRINSSGNVGIGNTSPSTLLTVGSAGNSGVLTTPTLRLQGYDILFGSYGGMILNCNNGQTSQARRFLITNALGSANFGIIRSTDATTDPALTNSGVISSGTADFVINNSGNVGIGTSSPLNRLHVAQSLAGTASSSDGIVRIANTRLNTGDGASTLLFVTDEVDGSTQDKRGQIGGEYDGSNGGRLVFSTAQTTSKNMTERMRINSSGNVGIAQTSPSGRLHVGNTTAGTGDTDVYIQSPSTDRPRLRLWSGTTSKFEFSVGSTAEINAVSSIPMTFFTDNTERMRITSGGNVLIGTTDSSSNSGNGIKLHPDGFVGVVANSSRGDTYNYYNSTAGAYRFYVTNAGVINATSTTITAISDQRLKENIRDLDVGLSEIMSIKPRRFDWKKGRGLDKKNDIGFIAQEFETVFPNSVTLSKSGEDGIEYKSVSQSELIPTLVKAIQEQQAMIVELTNRIKKLEGA